MDKRWHSVYLDEEACKGCTVCVTTCPTEAIRVLDGKARIMEERCIDCGECIRRCPHHAKKARTDSLSVIDKNGSGEFDFTIALPAPSLYGQFPIKFSIPSIHAALRQCGFDAVFPVTAATGGIAAASAIFLDRCRYPDLPRPLISSSCPAIVRLIQIRFPSLLGSIVPVIAPMELAGRLAREMAKNHYPEAKKVGVFFISPCAGKITEAKSPIGDEISSVDGVFSMTELYLPLLTALNNPESLRDEGGSARDEERSRGAVGGREHLTGGVSHSSKGSRAFDDIPTFAPEIAWGRRGGEAEDTTDKINASILSVDGMDQCIKILEAAEDGKLESIEFLELMACVGGCVGGPLAPTNQAIARHILHEREKALTAELAAQYATDVKDNTGGDADSTDVKGNTRGGASATDGSTGTSGVSRKKPENCEKCLRTERVPPRPALQLDPDYATAVSLMEKLEVIKAELPGLDCGCCGAPSCRALAEDIVKGNAQKTDCVFILKEEYLDLLAKKDKNINSHKK